MSRVELTDSKMDAMIKISDGNPGCIMAMMEIMEKTSDIDPQALMGGLGSILMFDTWEIYGSEIYILFNDECDRDVRKLLMLMRAVQLGIFPKKKLKEMAADGVRKANLTEDEFNDLDKQVCDQLVDFKR